MIVRLIVFVAIFSIGWWLYRQFVAFKHSQAPAKKSQSQTGNAKTKPDQQEPMVRCEHCGTFVPRSHAVHDQEARAFCSNEHLKAFHSQQ
ncbi:PP0621 family protein [Marinomonas algarum]|uniref:TRASH domain-containing protein n=1 Tax=Marinomonas algarum TaxID=2883105 RepID=A0A9X1IN30_9GAMM|nr:PP0621 family protein [Marinomonas algarum]MCB5161346.1 hypothetical protein [Marinomonas algarum]